MGGSASQCRTIAAARRALLVFEDGSIIDILIDRPLGTVLLLVVIYTFYDGIFRRGKEAGKDR